MGLFEKEIKISGKHSLYISEIKESKLLPTYREIYVLCTAIGYLFGLKSDVDRTENVTPSSIFPENLAAQRSNLRFLYRLIMLTDDKEGYSTDDYKNRAFRDDAIEDNDEKMKENMEIFNSYFRGGLEKVYDLVHDSDGNKQMVNTIHDFLLELCEDYDFILDE